MNHVTKPTLDLPQNDIAARRAVSITKMLRRIHLYSGLCLLPWAILYGITAFLFNHPTFFSDQQMRRFRSEAFVQTPWENPVPAEIVADAVVQALNVRFRTTLKLDEKTPPKYDSEFVFGKIEESQLTIQFLFHHSGSGGTMRWIPKRNEDVPPAFPQQYQVYPPASSPAATSIAWDPLRVESSLDSQLTLSLPKILRNLAIESTGSPVLTSVPDLRFAITDETQSWNVLYNSLRGTLVTAPPKPGPISNRQWLLRFHVMHGYPDTMNAQWWWALIADAMAISLIVWGITGLSMWWRLQSTRRVGFVLIVLSFLFAASMAWLHRG